MPFGLQPTFQRDLEFTESGGKLVLADIDPFGFGLQLVDHRTETLQVAGNRTVAPAFTILRRCNLPAYPCLTLQAPAKKLGIAQS